MSVLVETSAGEIVIDLHCTDCPLTTKNFLKLCKIKYYNGCLFYNVQQNFIVQTGDPSGTGDEGTSVYGLMYGPQARAFEGEIRKNKKHNKIGLVSMAADSSEGAPPANRSQFFITLRDEDMEHLDGKHTIFGEVAEGFETLSKLNELYCDEDGRPFQDVRIKHTYVLDDPFDDPPQLEIPPSSPDIDRPKEEKVNKRIPFEEGVVDAVEEGRSMAELEESIRRKEAESRAIVLEMTGDIPDAEVSQFAVYGKCFD
jgi:peptidyl-prolyl cis-trans isomerase-like 4